MEKSQLKIILNKEKFPSQNFPKLDNALEEMSWEFDVLYVALKEKEADTFFKSIGKLKTWSMEFGFEQFQVLCEAIDKSDAKELPHIGVFMNTIYDYYFLLRREVREQYALFETDAEQKKAA